MIHHSTWSLDYMEQNARRRYTKEGLRLSKRELRAIAAHRAQGRTYWPGCDNVDASGRCKGHEEETT